MSDLFEQFVADWKFSQQLRNELMQEDFYLHDEERKHQDERMLKFLREV